MLTTLFRSYAGKLLNDNGYQNPRAGQNDDNAHPPITPCKAVDPNTIGNQAERNVYILVVKHYLACCSRDAVGKETTLTVKLGPEEFTAKGLMIIERNWLEIYAPWERWSTGQGQLPALEVGSRFTPTSFLLQDGRTAPPRLLTETELISLMDRNGIGTDATIASHIQTIQDRGYSSKNAQQEFSPTKLGIALVEGYNSMGYQLNKPDLRRETEHECNLVANGQKTMEDIMGPILAKMKECFERATAEAHKLDAAMARHFAPLGARDSIVLQARFSECGVCHNIMSLKETRPQNNNDQNQQRRKLLYCDTCQLGLSLPRGNVQPATAQENGGGPALKCPICQYQVVRVPRDSGTSYAVCPKCYSDPPGDHGGDPTGGETFPCFRCQHPTCSLATGTQGSGIQVFPCTFCADGKITLRKTSRGSFAMSCSNYRGRDKCDYSIWMPNEASTISVPEGDANLCRRCSTNCKEVRQLHFVWKTGSVPMHMGRECKTCVLCDAAFRQEMNIRLPQPNQVRVNQRARSTSNSRTRAPNRNNAGGRGRGGGRGGQGATRDYGGREGAGAGGAGIVCFRCNQPGHYANACPARAQ